MSDQTTPYLGTIPVPSLGGAEGTITLVEGRTFCLSGRSGDVNPDFPQGLFVLDTRVLSSWSITLNGHAVEPLVVDQREPFAGLFVGRGAPHPGHADADLVVFRSRNVGYGMREVVTLVNYGQQPAALLVELTCDADFAALFEVKEGRVAPRRHQRGAEAGALRFERVEQGTRRVVTVTPSVVGEPAPGHLSWVVNLPAGDTWTVCLVVTLSLDGSLIPPRFVCGGVDEAAIPTRQMAMWQAQLPTVVTDSAPLARAVRRAGSDLGALRIFDPEWPETPILAAGAPWFMTVFGRDSLVTGWMTLIADHSVTAGVLETLARFQGSDVRGDTEEEPGKILHEMRFEKSAVLALGGAHRYYGSVDATPLFVMLLGEFHRWADREDIVRDLLPHADRALAWMQEFGDVDGDGYIEYRQQSESGLANQGWKDSWDAIRHLDGTLAPAPIALCEVQAYSYAAHVARSELAEYLGDHHTARRQRKLAGDLKARFNRDFWSDELGWFALGLDADKRPIGTLTSNIGHCLWTGIVDDDKAAAVADALLSPEMFSGFGVRTLSASMPSFNPVSYHNGSVWPHDNALCAAGLARYGFVAEAGTVIAAQLDAAQRFHGRLPELFAGFDRTTVGAPAEYPTSCSPQAWAAAAPLLWLRTVLGLQADAPGGTLHVAPTLPPGVETLEVSGIRVGTSRVSVRVAADGFTVDGLGDLRISQ